MVKLNESFICGRTRTTSVQNVRRLNCWGCDLDDISILEDMPNIEVLSLSVNNISTLKPFGECRRLRELYLRGNRISDLKEVEYLRNLTDLRTLWLDENPCAQVAGYRNFVLKTLPFLSNLDNRPVAQSETREAWAQRVSSPQTCKLRRAEETQSPSRPVAATGPTALLSPELARTSDAFTTKNSYDVGYESASPEHSTKPLRGREFYYHENACTDYRPSSSSSTFVGGASPETATSRFNSTNYVVSRPPGGNVLKAIITLLDDLDEPTLNVVAREVSIRLQNHS